METIVNRSADRPVRRWLLSIDPDPNLGGAQRDEPEQPPPVDSTVLRSVATIPRYQSIVRDLLALEEHNEKVAAAEVAIYEGERALAAAGDGGGGGGEASPPPRRRCGGRHGGWRPPIPARGDEGGQRPARHRRRPPRLPASPPRPS